MDRLISRLLKEGKLRKIPAGFNQVEALLKEAILDSIYFEHDLPALGTVLEVFSKVQKRIDIKKLS